MTFQSGPARPVRSLTESNGAPRHEDAKQVALIKAAVSGLLDERDNKLVQKLEKIVERFENGNGSPDGYRRGFSKRRKRYGDRQFYRLCR